MKTKNTISIEVKAVDYAIKLTNDDFQKIEEYELNHEDTKSLHNILIAKFNIYNVDYNNHFGSYIFFSILNENNTIDIREKIIHFIDNFIKQARILSCLQLR